MSPEWAGILHFVVDLQQYPDDLLDVPYLADAPYDADAVAMCPKGHGPQEIVDESSTPGFTGARISFWTLACGDTDQDLSADTLEAVR